MGINEVRAIAGKIIGEVKTDSTDQSRQKNDALMSLPLFFKRYRHNWKLMT